MVYLDQITTPSNHVATRAAHCWARRIVPGIYRVVPFTRGFSQHRGKTKRRVQFGVHGSRVFVLCSDWFTGEICPANSHGRICAHVWAAYQRFVKSIEQESKAA